MKKKFFAIVFLICFTAFSFCGCSIVETNKSKFYNSPIVVIDNDICITREEFSTYYANYYNYYAEMYKKYGLTNYQPQIKVDDVLKALIQQKLILREAKKDFTLTNSQKNEIWKNVYSQINTNIKSYYEEIKLDWNIKDEEKKENSSNETEPSKIEEYIKKVELKLNPTTNKYELIKVSSTKQDAENVIGGIENYKKDIDDEKLFNEGYNRYIKDIKNSLENKGETVPESDDEILAKELNRLYKNYEESYFVDLYNNNANNYVDVTLDEVKARINELVKEDYLRYTIDNEDYKTDVLDSSKASEIYYHINKSSDYFSVTHILIKFNDDDIKAEGDSLNTQKDGGLSNEAYMDALFKLMEKVKTNPRNDEFVKDKTTEKTAKAVYDELITALNSKTNFNDKAKLFVDYINKYNEDPGITTSNYNYVMSKDSDNKMDKHFYETSKYLYTEGTLGGVDVAMSSYGFHIIMYCGTPSNGITIDDIENYNVSDSDLLKLNNTIVKAGINKNYIDKVYEELLAKKFTEYKDNLLQKAYDESLITIYYDKINALLGK